MNIPAGLKYTKDHEWTKVDGKRVTVGITAFAVEQLGDIIESVKAFGTIESVKTLSDLFAPVSGKVVEINKDLDSKPELVNEDCYAKAWMVIIETTDDGAAAVAGLMDEKAYAEHVKA